MTPPAPPVHLVERAARRLRETASLAGAPPPEPPPAPLAPAAPIVPLAAAESPAPEPPALDLTALERAGMIGSAKNRDRVSEEFRLVQGQLRHLMPPEAAGAGSNLVMLTSARPGEGKSFAAINLAAALARSDKRAVLLVDADATPRALSERLGLAAAPGLLDLAVNPARTPNEMVVRTSLPNLSILPVGGGRERREIAASLPVVGVVEQLARRFANCIVVLDAPPCLSSSDPAALAAIVGQIVMVVEAERTQRNEVESALELVQACPVVTLLLNKARLTGADTFGAYF
jgi:protein-tyrosine kinase